MTTTATLADLLPELTWTPADADTDGYHAADFFDGVDWAEPVTDRAAALLALLDAYRGSDSDGVGLSHSEWPAVIVRSREAWLAFAPNATVAATWEDQCLSIGRDLLPDVAIAVLDDREAEPAPAYWQWLADQWAQADQDHA